FTMDTRKFEPMENFAGLIEVNFARKHGFVLGLVEEKETLLISKPFVAHGYRQASLYFADVPEVLLTTDNQLKAVLDLAYRQRNQEEKAETMDVDELSDELQENDNLMNVRDKSPLVKLFYESITYAVDNQASDIHYQPLEEGMIIRQRIDGVLQDVRQVQRSQQDALISLIKVMGSMDIAERRKTQDGRATRWYSDKKIDIRISVVPTSYGERAVLRLLIKTAKLLDVEELGLKGENNHKMEMVLNNFNNGIVLLTGPTGSGKSTTLCAVLTSLQQLRKGDNIMTIEDPIEYELSGISQLEVQVKKNVTFATGLRALVRQDPDIMMVGEIRDEETANMAVQAALTGHLVFSTMHTNDAPGSISRLQDLGVESYLIASSVVVMMAQRLVRRVCSYCAETYMPDEEEMMNLGVDPARVKNGFKRGKGCPECFNRGYRGRVGIYEILLMNDIIRDQIVSRVNASAIKRDALKRGDMLTLRMDGIQKVLEGMTSSEEVMRMTQTDIY
ncbi:MAG: type II/IV secretion system protein, partial [Planctomycetes bacterium]|nr:type II/IV secretion system protein [Planctomycetota bacterium]